MVKRKCYKCNALFDRKSTYDYHINRKFYCIQNKDNDNEDSELFQNFPNLSKTFPIFSKFIQDFSNDKENEIENDKENEIENEIENDKEINSVYDCSFCLKLYSSKGNLVKHLKICKVKKVNDEEKVNKFKLLLEKDKQHKEEVDELKKQNKKEVNELKKQNKLLMDKINNSINNSISKNNEIVKNS